MTIETLTFTTGINKRSIYQPLHLSVSVYLSSVCITESPRLNFTENLWVADKTRLGVM